MWGELTAPEGELTVPMVKKDCHVSKEIKKSTKTQHLDTLVYNLEFSDQFYLFFTLGH